MRPFHLVTAAGLLVVLVMARPAAAQAAAGVPADVFAGFSTLRELGTDDAPATAYDRGWVVSASAPVWWRRLSVTGEASGHSRANIVGETQRLLALLGGARVSLFRASRLGIFGQALAGVERFSEPGFEESGFAFQPGAGVDLHLWKAVAVRGQVDYRTARQNGATYREVRLAAGAVVSFPTSSP